ncbi:MAG: thiosulfate oxidation carrier protein SoxY [Rhodobacteraceae bacterium]|nr:thiosulfate oxidation carrier protein SoxY [Paracoccaceae bacterium]
MQITRRNALMLGGTAIAVTLVPIKSWAATSEIVAAEIAKFAGDATIAEGGIDLTTPEIAENGNTVPVRVSAPGAKRIMLLAEGNPNPGVVTFSFSALAVPSASTRIRLAGTQNVVAIAELENGSYTRVASAVKVTIGGCGG